MTPSQGGTSTSSAQRLPSALASDSQRWPSARPTERGEIEVGCEILTFDEMCSYFAQVGTALNDEEFDLIVEEMRTAATAYALAMTLQE